MKKILTVLSLVFTSTYISLAQTINVNTTGVGTQGQVNAGPIVALLKQVSAITGMLAPIFITLAVLAFFWFLVTFIWKGRDDAKEHEKSLKGMGYSILALFVMVSIWGIIAFVGSTFGIGQGGSSPIPAVPVIQ